MFFPFPHNEPLHRQISKRAEFESFAILKRMVFQDLFLTWVPYLSNDSWTNYVPMFVNVFRK